MTDGLDAGIAKASRQASDAFYTDASQEGSSRKLVSELEEKKKAISGFQKFYYDTQNAPTVTGIQSLSLDIAHSPFMKAIEWGAKNFKPIELFDELSGTRLIRETYTTDQLKYIGKSKDLSMWSRGVPEGIKEEGHTFFAYGHLFSENLDGGYNQIAGRFSLFSKAGIGSPNSFIENTIDNLSGRSFDPSHISNMLNGEGKDLESESPGGIRGKIARLTEEAGKSKDNPIQLRKLNRQIKLLQQQAFSLQGRQQAFLEMHSRLAGNKDKFSFRRLRQDLDLGYNVRGHSPLSKTYWSEGWNNFFRQFNPSEDLANERTMNEAMPFDVVRSFGFSRKDVADSLFGGLYRDPLKHDHVRDFNTGTVLLHHLFMRVNDSVAHSGLTGWAALSSASATSPASLIQNMMLKRALPAYAAFFYAGYANDTIGQMTGTRPTDGLSQHGEVLGLKWADYKDRHGWTQHIRHLNELSGGALGYIAHPFVDHQVGMSREELEEYNRSGVDPVRKGRWWSFGSSTPFRGERVMYFNPSHARYSKAGDIYKTDTLWGSADEYYANAALPTPTHPFAPLHHFITDRYHWEEKHLRDRPYPVSSPLFEPTTLHGVILNPTLGRILKPQRFMHEDEMPYIVHGPHRGERNPHYRGEIRELNQQIKDAAASREVTGFVTPSGSIQPMQSFGLPGSDRQVAAINEDIAQEASERDAGYTDGTVTGSYDESGSRAVVPHGSGKHQARQAIREANATIKQGAAAKRFTGGRMLEPIAPPGLFGNMDPNDPRIRRQIMSTNDPRYQAGLGYYSLTEIGGIYGFGTVSATGDLFANRPMLADAGRMTGFERTYWDRWNTGGMLPTPELSEAARRFMPHRFHSNSDYNPIRNTMAAWLPGSSGQDPAYFMDFLHGDPYVKIPNGEARLPGEAYERLHGIGSADLSLKLSQVGYDKSMMHAFLTGQHAPFAAFSEEVAERSADIQDHVIRSLRSQGLLIESNIPFQDDKHDVNGMIDAIVKDGDHRAVLDIHTLSDKRFGNLSAEGDARYREQLNFELGSLGMKNGQMLYVNRDTGAQKSIDVTFSQSMYNATLDKIKDTRRGVYSAIRHGDIPTGALYNDMTKFSILADVAPWSQQYKIYRDYLTHLDDRDLDPADRARIQEIKKEVTIRKKRFNMTPFKLRYSEVSDENVTVKNIIDSNTFTTLEHPDNPIRLAGVHIHSDEVAQEWLKHNIYQGAHLRIATATDPTRWVSKDSLHTIRAAVYSGRTQLNRAAISQGYGTAVDENDPAGLQVKYTAAEIRQGRWIERLAHMPIPFLHNKFMPVDSPLDLYKKTQVYGKDWQDWRHPFSDYIFPSFESFAQQGWPGLLGATVLGISMGTNIKSRLGLVGLGIGITEVLHEFRKTQPIPGYRRQERDIDEYFDVLKYVKYEGLYEKTRSWIKDHQHHDIGAIADSYQAQGEQRKRRIQVLKTEKRQLIVSGGAARHAERIKEINAEINSLQSYRKELNLSREDVLALQYRSMAETTLYGADSHGNLSKTMLAMDPKEREFFQAFMKAAGPEREQILKLVPNDERRFLEAAWGMKPEEKMPLTEYFKHHNLPGKDWSGWRADSSLDDYKLVVMKDEGVNLTSHGFWPQDEARVADMGLWDVHPGRSTEGDIKTQLHAALSGQGLRNIDINLIPNQVDSHMVHVNVRHSRKDQASQYQGNI
jgi:hypothetical protein